MDIIAKEDLEAKLAQLDPAWKCLEGEQLQRSFNFKGFLKTMSFINAVAWEANKQMHHPDVEFSFNTCTVRITTHDVGNHLTQKDFKLAHSIDQLLETAL